MSGEATAAVAANTLVRAYAVDGANARDIFDVQSVEADIIRVRTPLLFEIGEELALRIVDGASTRDVFVRVRAHVGPADARVTELELLPT
ncbi:MAG TPA: hypothetical protein VGM90_05085 [Kofleriaceae bacterium]|jgi:hypothetical protein